jgi:hypothetical protein
MVALEFRAMARVVIENVALVDPAGMVTLAGTTADTELLVRDTTMPPVGAIEVRVAVPVEDAPPFTLVGLTEMELSAAGVTVREAVAEVLFAVAVMVAVVLEATALVVMLKVAVVAPEATVTELGTAAALLLLERLAENPAEGAGLARVTVPVEATPPATLVGLTATVEMVGAEIARVAVEVPLRVAVMVALTLVATATVVTVKVAVLEPDATVTLLGTVAEAELLLRATDFPPEGALVEMVTVPVEVVPPLTDVGESVTDEMDCAWPATGINIARKTKRTNL